MAAVTASAARPRPVPADGYRASVAGTLRSEFTKIRSVRSTYWTLFLLVAAGVAWSIAYCAGEASKWPTMSAQDKFGFDPTQSSVVGLTLLGQLVIVVLGTLTLTSEYSTGMIRTSLTVMPQRGVLYAAKASVFAAVALVVAFLASFASFFIGQALGEIKENLAAAAGGADDDGRIALLVGAAHENAKQTLAELRDLARGIHPPASFSERWCRLTPARRPGRAGR